MAIKIDTEDLYYEMYICCDECCDVRKILWECPSCNKFNFNYTQLIDLLWYRNIDSTKLTCEKCKELIEVVNDECGRA